MALDKLLPPFRSGLLNSAAIALSAVACSQCASALRMYLVQSSDLHCRYKGHVVLRVLRSSLRELAATAHLKLVWERPVFWALVPQFDLC